MIAGDLLFEQAGAGRSGNYDRSVPTISSPIEPSDYEGDRSIGLLTTIEQSDGWFSDPTGRLMILQGDRMSKPPCSGVCRSVLPELHYGAAKIFARHTIGV